MAAINYVNGEWLEADKAQVPMEDRGHQFGDGIYDVAAFFNRTLLDVEPHILRLARSLHEIRIENPHSTNEWLALFEQAVDKNDQEHGGVYVQVTRGAYKRDHPFKEGAKPSITLSVFGQKTPSEEMMENGVKVISQEDIRWKRCDIKTINLLPNVLAKQAAVEAGVRESIMTKENGEVTEASVSNFFAVIDGVIRTHPATNEILNGITRQVVIEQAKAAGMAVEERAFTLEELKTRATEAFITSTTSNVLPAVQADETPIGDGKVGEVSKKLSDLYASHIKQQTGHVIYG